MFYKWEKGYTQLFWDTADQTQRQEKLDQLFTKYFGQITDGTFVEAGAFDGCCGGLVTPLANVGWTGIFVEACNALAETCRTNFAHKENIKVIHKAVSNKTGETVQLHGASAGATIDRDYIQVAQSISWAGAMTPGELVTTITLDDLLKEQNIEPGFEVLSVDIEGHEPAVLKDFDLKHWKPKLLCVEMTDDHPDFKNFTELNNKYRELRQNIIASGYEQVHRDIINTVYVRSDLY
jgi:FkbM family methyltransferase